MVVFLVISVLYLGIASALIHGARKVRKDLTVLHNQDDYVILPYRKNVLRSFRPCLRDR